MQSNISINLGEKNNKKSASTSRAPRTRRSSNTQKMTSEAFLRHKNKPVAKKVDDPTKLIKKGEIPVRVFGLGGLEQI